eukprot:CAMPEP_0170132686 /NCGR_PEP_ID=MMETSP0033_2-20121228/690_1 /TAXON_ID=195969 /ORGANISM="Dolichomastix tenuilepis, Strain CCMP3274" /LENGTH=133 /DNA_ID=CAMNT_0010368101 /DNA_START=46 /DNA_END=444 /DNA_ORIENTATION=-
MNGNATRLYCAGPNRDRRLCGTAATPAGPTPSAVGSATAPPPSGAYFRSSSTGAGLLNLDLAPIFCRPAVAGDTSESVGLIGCAAPSCPGSGTLSRARCLPADLGMCSFSFSNVDIDTIVGLGGWHVRACEKC